MRLMYNVCHTLCVYYFYLMSHRTNTSVLKELREMETAKRKRDDEEKDEEKEEKPKQAKVEGLCLYCTVLCKSLI